MITLEIAKYEPEVLKHEEKPVETGGILLYGSSFFANWKSGKEQIAKESGGKYNIVNHGFGGATVLELMHYYDRLVIPYKPEAVIFRLGVNDINKGFPAGVSVDLSEALINKFKKDFPGIKIIFLGCFDYPSMADENKPVYVEYNAKTRALIETMENAYYLDINEFMYESKDDIGTFKNFREIFRYDNLHLTPEAYEEFAKYFTKKLDEIL